MAKKTLVWGEDVDYSNLDNVLKEGYRIKFKSKEEMRKVMKEQRRYILGVCIYKGKVVSLYYQIRNTMNEKERQERQSVENTERVMNETYAMCGIW